MSKVDLYRQIELKARVESASPHQLISLMYSGLLSSLADLRQALESKDLEAKSRSLTKAIGILNGLHDNLDTSVESEIPHNVGRLYDYMIRRLLDAGRELDESGVAEVTELVLTIKSGWDGIAPQPTEGGLSL